MSSDDSLEAGNSLSILASNSCIQQKYRQAVVRERNFKCLRFVLHGQKS